MESSAYMFQHIKAKNDANGNPQRLFIEYNISGEVVNVIDEEYNGMPKRFFNIVQLPSINISVGEYKEWKKWAQNYCWRI